MATLLLRIAINASGNEQEDDSNAFFFEQETFLKQI
jgi:hypothetical protein